MRLPEIRPVHLHWLWLIPLGLLVTMIFDIAGAAVVAAAAPQLPAGVPPVKHERLAVIDFSDLVKGQTARRFVAVLLQMSQQ